jgi:hypothetical protein
MHGISLLKKWLERNGSIKHLARVDATLRVVDALLNGAKLALTHLGRHRVGGAFVKHHIKAVDRLLGNRHLHRERIDVYAALARDVLSGLRRPLIMVDWADCELERELLILRAAVPVRGRTFTIYEEVHPLRRYNSPKTHRAFLDNLRHVIPAGVQPVVVTDAGFRGPWFQAVEALGWDWIGRIRNTIKYFKPETGRWCYVHSLYPTATHKVQHIGERCLSKRHRYRCRLYLVRAHQRRPGRPIKRKRSGSNHELYRQLHRAPWLLATSLPHSRGAGQRIMRAYEQRMQIEEAFRDLKNHRWGFALRYARSTRTERLEMLLLLALLAFFVVWLAGFAAHALKWERHFQANTERRRTVLSIPFLGQQVLSNPRLKLTSRNFTSALPALLSSIATHAEYA